ncbi:MAG: isoprenylcysteine carboxylmethyltransferase family protein [Acidobacteriota bacterium]
MDGLAAGLGSGLHWTLISAGGATFIVFAVALQNFFVQPEEVDRRASLAHDTMIAVGVIHLVGVLTRAPAGVAWAFGGIVLYSLSLGVFLSALDAARRVPLTRVFVLEPRPDRVITGGPFRYIRHPIYLAYSLGWLAGPIANHSPVLLATALAMVACYVVAARQEDAYLLGSPLAEQYRAYRRRTWWVIPFVL